MDETTKARWDRAERMVRRQVALLNDALGFAETAPHRVTFGYIGNLPFGAAAAGPSDSRLWSVYLPHPGRFGTVDDRIGSVGTGDVDALAALAGQVASFRRGITWARAEAHLVATHNERAQVTR